MEKFKTENTMIRKLKDENGHDYVSLTIDDPNFNEKVTLKNIVFNATFSNYNYYIVFDKVPSKEEIRNFVSTFKNDFNLDIGFNVHNTFDSSNGANRLNMKGIFSIFNSEREYKKTDTGYKFLINDKRYFTLVLRIGRGTTETLSCKFTPMVKYSHYSYSKTDFYTQLNYNLNTYDNVTFIDFKNII